MGIRRNEDEAEIEAGAVDGAGRREDAGCKIPNSLTPNELRARGTSALRRHLNLTLLETRMQQHQTKRKRKLRTKPVKMRRAKIS